MYIVLCFIAFDGQRNKGVFKNQLTEINEMNDRNSAKNVRIWSDQQRFLIITNTKKMPRAIWPEACIDQVFITIFSGIIPGKELLSISFTYGYFLPIQLDHGTAYTFHF